MTANRDLDTIMAAWLDEGPSDLPGATRRAIVAALPTTTQSRRGLPAPWRLFDMNGFERLAGAALVAVVAIGGLIYALQPSDGPGMPSPSPATPTTAPTAAPSAAPTAAASAAPGATVAMEVFVSPRYGYSIQHPTSFAAAPATEDWPVGAPFNDPYPLFADRFRPPESTLGAIATVAAQPVRAGTSDEEWMDSWAAARLASDLACFGPGSEVTDAVVDGAPAVRIDAPCVLEDTGMTRTVEYAWVIDGTAYVLTGTPAVVEQMVVTFQAP